MCRAQLIQTKHGPYKVLRGTYYHPETPDEVVAVFETCRDNRTRIRVDYGHTTPEPGKEVGQSWGEVYDITGYVGRTCGEIKCPILVYNSRSMGGGIPLTHCIVRIETTRGKETLYQHPNFKPYTEAA